MAKSLRGLCGRLLETQGATDVHCANSTAPRSFVHVAFRKTYGTGEVRDSNTQGMMRYSRRIAHCRIRPPEPSRRRLPPQLTLFPK